MLLASMVGLTWAAARGQPLPSGTTAEPSSAHQRQRPDKAFFRTFQQGPFREGNLYVRFELRLSRARVNALHAAAGARQVIWQSRIVPGLCRVSVEKGKELSAANRYLDDPGVMYTEPVYAYESTTTPNDPRFDELWGMLNARADHAWDMYTGNAGVKVAVLDTGIDYSHEDIAANIWTNPDEIAGNGIDDDGNGYVDDVHGYDFGEWDSDPFDSISECGSHGTHVSGTIGAVGDNATGVAGVNWRCSLVACKVFDLTWDDDDQEWKCLAYNTPEALEYALIVGCRLSNNSWGGYTYQQAMYDMLLGALDFGHLFVASAGNDALNVDGEWPHYPSGYDLPNIVAVAAIDEDDELASFSNYGDTTVDLGAPGDSILSTIAGGYDHKDGTSMATPHVTGAAALVLGRYPDFSWRRLRDRIFNSVRLIDDLAAATATGGTLDVLRALGIWIDFDYGGEEEGSLMQPFNTMEEGLMNTPVDGNLHMKPGTTTWTGTIHQTLTIEVHGGGVVLGD
jgi:subtilisin family serine protease